MKKLVLFLIVLIIIVPFNGIVTSAEDEGLINSYGYDFMAQFVESYPMRDAGTEGEAGASLYLADFFESMGYEPYYNEFVDTFNFIFNKRGYNSQNIVAIKRSRDNISGKSIIIGAHYDSVYEPIGSNIKGGEGAYDNGSGVGALAQIAYELKDIELNLDIIFAAFGAEEVGLFGSQHMASMMTKEQIENTILMINIDSISCGDYLYLYTDEVRNIQEDYMISLAEEMDIELRRSPIIKKAYPVKKSYNGLNYNHLLFRSDHAPFMELGIDIAFFIGYNLDTGILPYTESLVLPNVMHTEGDTVENILNLYGEQVITRINDTAKFVITIISDPEIISIMELSRADKYKYRWMTAQGTINAISLTVKLLVAAIIIIIGINQMNKERKYRLNAVNDNTDGKERIIFEDLGI